MRFKCALLIAAVLAGAAPAWAETLEERVERLEQELQAVKHELALTRKAEALPPEAAAQRGPAGPARVTADASGFSLRSADDAFQLRVRGLVHLDGRFFADDEPGASTFLARRIRIGVSGTVAEHYSFLLTPDFGNGSTTLIDGYVDVDYWRAARLRAGKFKAPLSLQRLQATSEEPFVEIGMPASNLLPNREIGVQVLGDLWDGGLSYAVSLGNGSAGGASPDADVEDDKDVTGRLFAHPFAGSGAPALRGLGVGIAASAGHNEGALPVYRTSGQQTFFSYRADTAADGRRLRVVPQGYYYWGPFGVSGEFAMAAEEVTRAGAVTDVENYGWSLAASYFLTGEDNSYRAVKILWPLAPGGGAGAVELKARYTGVRVDGGAFASVANPAVSARRADALNAGLNWHLNQHVKWLFDYEHTMFEGGASVGDREDEDVVLTRLQLVY